MKRGNEKCFGDQMALKKSDEKCFSSTMYVLNHTSGRKLPQSWTDNMTSRQKSSLQDVNRTAN
jgi:hypothetical protein